MTDYRIYSIDKNTFTAFNQLEKLFEQFYSGMQDQGLLLPLVEDGGKLWVESVRLRLGKLAFVYVAETESQIIGFSAGFVKFIPNYLGGSKVGFIDGIYLLPEYRKGGIAIELYQALESMLMKQQVQSIELQVLIDNIGGIRFWEKAGYQIELKQMRKLFQ